ncbi:hypothetical protein DPMN_079530 [Dreissena polymorpha]|uniref:Uncharacterized protein n=1 Tax=Dreissena polymorpha TaxID=45954 RepID=A0A9D3YP74_DREPO|nr:hypothetical protein DPMN_079530 [Dreissena polymorpha]
MQDNATLYVVNKTTGIHTDQVENKPDMVTDFQSTKVPVEMSERTVTTNRLNSMQDTPREVQVAQEEGYASIGGSECQYAVVNKPKKQSTLQVNQDPPVENKPMEMQSNPEKPSGVGEVIYVDLDKEALKAKPSNSRPAGSFERPKTPTEYVGIDFARTVALQDANKLEE